MLFISRSFWSRSLLATTLVIPALSAHAQSSNQTDTAQKNGTVTSAGIEEITVVGTNPERYQTSAGESLTGLPLRYLELPRIVDVIPEQILLDQKVTELEDALRNVPGVSLSDGFGGSNNDFLIRGFRRNTIYRNGLRVASNFRVNTTNLESVRVIKGPASITYGQVEPGGLVDIVTKKPLKEQRIYAEARAGSYDNYMLLADVSLPVSDKAAFRVNASSQTANSFRDFFDIERDAIELTAVYRFSDRTELNASYEYRDEFRSFDRGTITVPTPEGREILNNLVDVPLSRRFGEEDEEIDTQFQFASLDLTQAIGDKWEIKLTGAWEKSTSNDFQSRPAALVILDEDAPITDGLFTGVPTLESVYDEATDQIFLARRSDGSRDRQREVFYLQSTVTGEFALAGMQHRVALGANYRHYDESRYFVATGVTNGVPVAAGGNGPLFDVLNPVYGNLPDTLPTDGLPLLEAATVDKGLFLSDYIDITDQFSMLLGGRFDFSDVDEDGPAETVDAFSPQAALLFRPIETVSLFASYAEAFEPNTTFLIDDLGDQSDTELFPPENSKQYEAGIKAEFLDGKLKANAAIYSIKKQNVLTAVDGVPQLVEGQTSNGFELGVNGQPVPGMNILLGYAYTDGEIKTGANAGNRPANVADHTFNVWASYEIQGGTLQGLGSGLGAFYMSDRFGDNANSWSLGSYTLVDASLWYTLPASAFGTDGNVRLQLAVKNIFDETYYSASGGDLRVSIGTPRTVFASLAATF